MLKCDLDLGTPKTSSKFTPATEDHSPCQGDLVNLQPSAGRER